jgi:hypothetical protein
MADDTMCRQQTVQPEAVTSRLKAADNAYRRAAALLALISSLQARAARGLDAAMPGGGLPTI